MGKCRDKTKQFIKKIGKVVTPMLIRAGGNMVLELNKAGGLVGLLSGHDKRAIMIPVLKAFANAQGRDLTESAARTVNEYLYDNLVVEGVSLDDLADAAEGEFEAAPELA